MLGSGCTTLPGSHYPGGSVWVGRDGGGTCLVPGNPEEAAKVTGYKAGRLYTYHYIIYSFIHCKVN